jgi:Tfp pilus assembly protein PilV
MKNTNRGQSMFELLVAVFVIALTLTALVSLVTSAVGNTTFSRERTQASKFTQAAVEWLRAQRDDDWGAFKGKGNPSGITYCLRDLAWNTGSCSSSQALQDTNLFREATIIYNSASNPDSVEARVVTSWVDSNGTHESRVTTYFTNWRTR